MRPVSSTAVGSVGGVELVEIEIGSGGGVDCVMSGGSVIVRLVLTEMKKSNNLLIMSRGTYSRYFGTKQTLNI